MLSVRSLVAAALCAVLCASPVLANLPPGTPTRIDYTSGGVITTQGTVQGTQNTQELPNGISVKIVGQSIDLKVDNTYTFPSSPAQVIQVCLVDPQTQIFTGAEKVEANNQQGNGNHYEKPASGITTFQPSDITNTDNCVFIDVTGYTVTKKQAQLNIKFDNALKPTVPSSSTAGGLDDSSTLPPPVLDSSTGSGVTGDPQFTGFLGQSYQVHGTADTDYSIISSEKLQYNAHFDYLSEGKCREGTECYAHPGNYFGAVGMLLKLADGSVAKLRVQSGPVTEGMKVTIDGEPLTPSSKHLTIDADNSLHFSTPFELLLQTRDYAIKLQNSDMFLNQAISIQQPLAQQVQAFNAAKAAGKDTTAMVAALPHGVLGQTYRLATYPNRWVHIEGDLLQYIVGDVMAQPTEFARF